jgi:ABC-type xylose transport system permease subunit
LSHQEAIPITRMPIVGLLAWLVPGLGHIYLGYRSRGLVFLVTITATFWTGVAIGGVQGTVAPRARTLWFVAQLFTAGNALAAYGVHYYVDPVSARSPKQSVAAHWASAEIGVHYAGVAGLLNLLVIFDVIGCADPSLGSTRRRQPRKHSEGFP